MDCCLSYLFFCKYVLLAGDFNIDLLHASSFRERYHDLLIDFQLVQHIQDPTRVSVSSSTLIDYVMCSQDISVSNVIQATGVSDHRIQIVEFKIVTKQITIPSHLVHSLSKCCWDVCSCLSRALWSVLNIFDYTDGMWGYFHNILQTCLDTYDSIKRVRCKNFKWPTPWLTQDIFFVISAKHQVKRNAEHTHDPGDVDHYKSISKIV